MIIDRTNLDRLKITTRLLAEEALKKGYQVEFTPGAPSSGSGLLRCIKGRKELIFRSLNTALTPSYGFFVAEDKSLTYNLLEAAGVPVPQSVVISVGGDREPAYQLLAQVGCVVIKPVAANHGDGVTVGVSDRAGLDTAIDKITLGMGLYPDIVVQSLVPGDEYRFLVLDGKVIAVAGRVPAFVVGDGKSTISELIDIKNSDPLRGIGHSSALTRINKDDVIGTFGSEFLKRIPTIGEHVSVLLTSNLSKGGEAVDLTDEASRELKQVAARAAIACHQGVAGVDIITRDIEKGTMEDSVVIEVNGSPGIRMHQFPSSGKPRDIATKLFKAIERTATPIGSTQKHVGRVEKIQLPGLSDAVIRARIDTGATVSSLWASDIHVDHDNKLRFKLFGESSEHYDGSEHVVEQYSRRMVRSSNGENQDRYEVRLAVRIAGRRIIARFTLADRSTQLYPVLIGRNILRGKFVVDVIKGQPDNVLEAEREADASFGRIR